MPDQIVSMVPQQEVVAQLLLAEFRHFRDVEWLNFRDQVGEWRTKNEARLTALETLVEDGLVDNEQPSRLTVVERTVEELVRMKYWVLGWTAAVSGVCALIGWFFPRH